MERPRRIPRGGQRTTGPSAGLSTNDKIRNCLKRLLLPSQPRTVITLLSMNQSIMAGVFVHNQVMHRRDHCQRDCEQNQTTTILRDCWRYGHQRLTESTLLTNCSRRVLSVTELSSRIVALNIRAWWRTKHTRTHTTGQR